MVGKKILVADDSLTIQKVIRLALSGDGYQIQTVSDGKEALEQASLFRPDICIIDVSLPQFDAYQIMEQLKGKPDLKAIPIILMSSAFEKVDEPRMKALGFAGHLIKPFDPSHLRSTLLSVSNLVHERDPIEATVSELQPIQPPSMNTGFNEFSIEHTLSDVVQPHDEIRQLANNTLELAGLDQQEWGVVEPTKESPIETMPPLDFTREFTAPDFSNLPTRMNDSLGASASTSEIESMIRDEVAGMMSGVMEQLQHMVREKMDNEFRMIASKHIPDVAEKIIKDEIHRMLRDPPA